MLSADSVSPHDAPVVLTADVDDGPVVGLAEILTWLGRRKGLILTVTLTTAVAAAIVSMLLTPVFTARATLLAPGSQQQSSSATALAALGALSGIAGSLVAKSPDELYVGLLKSDTVMRALDERFGLKAHYEVETYETLRKVLPSRVRIATDKKSGLISVDVDDPDPKFAADLANAHETEVTRLLGRLAVTEAQLRRVFFEKQLGETKENLVKAEDSLRKVQEKSGVIVLDKQAEALITAAAMLRAQITEREVQLKVLRLSATERNPDVARLSSELRALRGELARMESSKGDVTGSAIDLPVGRLPEAAIEYVRARRELKIQETLLEAMLRQFEVAKLDEAKDGPALQRVDIALPPDQKSKPSRMLIVIASTLAAFLLTCGWVAVRGYVAAARAADPRAAVAWKDLRRAWRFGRG